MLPAAIRLCLAAALLLPAAARAQAPGRSAPSRPAAPAIIRSGSLDSVTISKVEYVSLTEAAKAMGLARAWNEKERQLTLTDGRMRVVLEVDSREVRLNGLRLFLGRPVALRRGVPYASRVDFERVLLPRIRPGMVPGSPGRPRVVALDPGHGGTDNGMENKALKLKEKVLTLDVAQRVEKILRQRGYRVVLTRENDHALARDKTTDFRKRAERANSAGADVFVSIHFNSLYPDTRTSGTETYTFTPTGQPSDRSWSPLEPDDTERDAMPVNRFDAWSSLLSQMMHREVIQGLKTLDRGQKTMHSAVLRGLNCPGVLIESVFLSNEAEARRAATPEYRQQIAQAIADGIEAYADAVERPRAKP